ncbi:hypothetical protein C8R47DRAFT_1079971 [Mycena vitilis]|nr:hypothetical protein C8R47DRAFT_1079971 [Mycena vitilis]
MARSVNSNSEDGEGGLGEVRDEGGLSTASGEGEGEHGGEDSEECDGDGDGEERRRRGRWTAARMGTARRMGAAMRKWMERGWKRGWREWKRGSSGMGWLTRWASGETTLYMASSRDGSEGGDDGEEGEWRGGRWTVAGMGAARRKWGERQWRWKWESNAMGWLT